MMNRSAIGLPLVSVLVTLAACSSTNPYIAPQERDWEELAPPPSSEQIYRVILIGDAGDASPEAPVLKLLRTTVDYTDEHSAVIFLGDNIYCCGLPDSGAVDRAQAEARLTAQLDAVKDFPGRIFFIPGNHDWNGGQPGGREALARQEAFVEAYLDRGNTFVPDDGYPGPIAIELTDRITLLALDTEWWLSDERPFGDTGAYRLREPTDLLFELRDLFVKHRNKDLLIIGHHPLFSNGKHSGHFSLTTHLTPFPILGSLEPLYRRFVGKRQDLVHEGYKLFRREMETLFASWTGNHLIYAAGHDHSLQYFEKQIRRNLQHHIVSGSGSKVDYVAPGRGATFTAATQGFITLQYYADQSIWLEAWTPEGDGYTGRLLFRHPLREPVPVLDEEPIATPAPEIHVYPDYRDSTIVIPANPGYAKGGAVVGALRAFWLGHHHRDLWATSVTAPVLDVARDAGGLTPIKMGGRSQSVTMRLQGGDGKTYMLRSIDKVAGRIWPAELQRTFARDMVQDQFAMLHPYGAFLIPPLADAAGIYHTNPRLVFVPDDPRLGAHRSDLAGTLALIEERPDGDMSDVASMGHPSNVIGYEKMMRAINNDNDHRVDARAWARSRLFDMLIADWDRTPDNWRWGVFEPYELNPALTGSARTQGKIYRPIPRDRDAAFTRINGLVPTLYKRLVERVWQDFRASYGYLQGLNKKGLADDRRFTASLTRKDWIEIAESIRTGLTDAVIEDAVRQWPDAIYEREGERVARLLKIRRDTLPQAAEDYYLLLARVTDVVGSNKHERFEVTRRNDDETEVVVFKTSKGGEIREELFRRTFYQDETKEVRLYGLDGNDQFIVKGTVRRGLLIRGVGGAGQDTFSDASRVRGLGRRTRFYDNVTGNTWAPGHETKVIRSTDPAVNAYTPTEYLFGLTQPLLFFGSNKDDGLFVGGGALITQHGFRKKPYARRHRIIANVAARTQAFNIRYVGQYTAMLNNWDLIVEASVFTPNTIRNFYGLGNETTNDEGDARFYQARLSQVLFKSVLTKKLEQGLTVHIGPTFEYIDIRQDDDRFVGQPQAGISENTFDDQWFGGIDGGLTLQTLDNPVNPVQGFRWTNTADLKMGLRNSADTYSRLTSDVTVYLSPVLSPQVTLAARVGGAHIVGEFPFYASSTLGGKTNLRGHRSTRFAGRTSVYANADLRIEVLDFAGYLAFGKAGVLGFFDTGRVWTDGESSRVWHRGYGGGLWFELFRAMVLNGTFGFSDDNQTFTLQLGFQY